VQVAGAPCAVMGLSAMAQVSRVRRDRRGPLPAFSRCSTRDLDRAAEFRRLRHDTAEDTMPG
jgi:hypothetical protein